MMLTQVTMDLITVTGVRVARSRADLALAPDEIALGGGTWLYSEPQPGVTGLVDLTGMGWEPVTRTPEMITIAATCPVATLRDLPGSALFRQCADSLLASWKIQNIATVGGNIATALPAGPMTSLAASLDGTAVIWSADRERRMPVAQFVTGVRTTALEPGEVLRAVELPISALHRTAFRRISLSPLGRTGTLVIGRRDARAETVITVTGGTTRPRVLRFATLPSPEQVAIAVDAIDDWYDDPHGAPDWRHAMSRRFALEILEELSHAV